MSQTVALRDAIAKGLLPGPRILTIVEAWPGEASSPARRTNSALTCGNKKKQARTSSKSTRRAACREAQRLLSQEQLNASL